MDFPRDNSSSITTVIVEDAQSDLKVQLSDVEVLVLSLLKETKIQTSEVSVYLLSASAIAELHEELFNDPSVTDCISVPINENFLGEIFVCPSVAIAYAKKENLCPWKELSLYIIHSYLHLIGYRDGAPEEKQVMESLQFSILEKFAQKGFLLTPQ